MLLLYGLRDYCSDRSANEPVRRSTGKVNAIAGANRRQQHQITAELEVDESSTSTSDESSDEEEMDTEPAEIALTESEASLNVTSAICDTVTVGSSAVSCQEDLTEDTAGEKTEHVMERQRAVNIVVNRTAEIQVFRTRMLKNLIKSLLLLPTPTAVVGVGFFLSLFVCVSVCFSEQHLKNWCS